MADKTDKEILKEQVHLLKKKGIIKFDSDIARDLRYSRGAVSEILSPTSNKPVTFSFKQKFKAKYGEHLSMKEESDLKELRAEVEVLRQSFIGIISRITGKEQALISAELDEAKRIILGGKESEY